MHSEASGAAQVRRDLALAAVAVALVVGLAAGYAIPAGESSRAKSAARHKPPPKGSVAARVDPGVVNINTNLAYEGAAAAGTGMVVSSSGVVITNNHVIEGATSISATDVGNGKTYNGRVIGYDRSEDVAVLQLEGASGLATVSLGNSASVPVGLHIVTIGNAGGTGGTPSAASGEVVALDQSITAGDELDGSPEHLSGLIEIQGEVEPGDSGGPLVEDAGRVIGMDTAASSSFQFESSAGQGFAIPAARFMSLADDILAGHASFTVHIGESAMLGVLIAASESGSSSGKGAPVEQVLRGSPAARADLKGGDLITGLDGQRITSASALATAMDVRHPGEVVRLSWDDANGRHHTATVRLASGPPS